MQNLTSYRDFTTWRLRLRDIFYLGGLVFCLASSTVLYLLDSGSPFLWVACVFSILLLIVRNSGSPPILIMGGFFLYITFSPYYLYFKGISLSPWADFQSFRYFDSVIYGLTCFIVMMGVCLSGVSKWDLKDMKLILAQPSQHRFYIALLISLGALIFGMGGDTIFDAEYYQGETDRSALHEYFIIPFFALLIFTNYQSKCQVLLGRGVLVAFIFKTLLYGGRIEVLQVLLLFLYFEYNFLKNVKPLKIILFAYVVFIFFIIIGWARRDVFQLIQNFQSFVGFADFLFGGAESKFISNTSSEVIYSSARIYGMVDVFAISTVERFLGFLVFAFNALAPSFVWPDYANLSRFKVDVYPSGGGGLISSYFFVWVDYVGPFVAGLAVGIIIRKAFSATNRYILIYVMLVLISFPRWFAYNPVFLVKFCVVGVFLVYVLDRLGRRKKSSMRPI